MPIPYPSRTAQVACQELLRLHLDETASVLTGALEVRRRGGRSYLYDKVRIGTQVRSFYIG